MATLALSALAQLALSFVSISYLSKTFQFGRRVIVLHVVMVAALWSTGLLCVGLACQVRRLRESPAARWWLTLTPLAGAFALGLLYFGDYVSNRLWARNLNYRVVAQNVAEAVTHGQGQAWLSVSILAAIGAATCLLLVLHRRVSPELWRGFESLFSPHSRHDLYLGSHRARLAAGSLLCVWAGIGTYLYACAQSPNDFRLPRFEPIASFVAPAVSAYEDRAGDAIRHSLERRQSLERADYRGVRGADRKNVILIIVDALRADRMSLYGYPRATTPFLSRLSKQGHLRQVTTALSTCSQTNCGITSTLSSLPYRLVSSANFKLYDLLRDQGYKTYFVLSGTHDWYGLKEYYSAQHDELFDGRESRLYNPNDDRLLFEGLGRVPEFAGTPAFFYFHLMGAHEYGIRQPRYNVFLPARWDYLDWSWLGPNHDEMSNWYDNGIRQADATIEQLLAELQRKRYTTANSLIVILADHGQGLGEHGSGWRHYGHSQYLYQEQIRIPMIVYDDRSDDYRNLDFATQLDVAPTIVDRLGLPIPASWQGRSLLRAGQDRMTVHQTVQQYPLYLVVWQTRTAVYKYLRGAEGPEELYEIVSDPAERHDLMSTADPAVIERLRTRLSQYLDDQ